MGNKILFRCSALGVIMTEPRSKSEVLSPTCKGKLLEIFIEKKYGRKKDITSKYLEKGTLVEEEAITLFSVFTKKFLKKNKENFKNDYLSGTPDIIFQEKIIDIKSSWNLFTFLNSKKNALDKDYYWQLQGYMELTGLREAELVYCLVDTPSHILESEKKSLSYKLGLGSEDDPIFEKFFKNIEKNGTFFDIPIEERIFIQKIEKNDADIEKLYRKIEICRDYLSNEFDL